MQLDIDKLISDLHQIRIYTDLEIKILNRFQIIWILMNSEISVNYVLQMFFIKNKWKDIRFLRKIWYINNKITYHYRIININYMIKNFERIFESEMISFHAMNMMKHDFILEISWLITHNFIMNWNAKLWHYYLADNWVMIEEFEVFIQFIQDNKTVY